MRNYFPLKTFREDSVLARLNEVYDVLRNVQTTYDEDKHVYVTTIENQVEIDGELYVVDGIISEGAIYTNIIRPNEGINIYFESTESDKHIKIEFDDNTGFFIFVNDSGDEIGKVGYTGLGGEMDITGNGYLYLCSSSAEESTITLSRDYIDISTNNKLDLYTYTMYQNGDCVYRDDIDEYVTLNLPSDSTDINIDVFLRRQENAGYNTVKVIPSQAGDGYIEFDKGTFVVDAFNLLNNASTASFDFDGDSYYEPDRIIICRKIMRGVWLIMPYTYEV